MNEDSQLWHWTCSIQLKCSYGEPLTQGPSSLGSVLDAVDRHDTLFGECEIYMQDFEEVKDMPDIGWEVEGHSLFLNGKRFIKDESYKPMCQSTLHLYQSGLRPADGIICQGKSTHEGTHFAVLLNYGSKVYLQWNNAPEWSKGMQEKIESDVRFKVWR